MNRSYKPGDRVELHNDAVKYWWIEKVVIVDGEVTYNVVSGLWSKNVKESEIKRGDT